MTLIKKQLSFKGYLKRLWYALINIDYIRIDEEDVYYKGCWDNGTIEIYGLEDNPKEWDKR